MSYCRFAWDGSDVYVYESDGGFECCGCLLVKKPSLGGWTHSSEEDMIKHLAQHKRAGHFVPFYAIEGLWGDIEGADKPVKEEPESMQDVHRMMWTFDYLQAYKENSAEAPSLDSA